MEHGTDRRATTLLTGEEPQVDLPGRLIVRKAGSVTTGGISVLEEVTFAPYSSGVLPRVADVTRVFYIVEGMLAFTIGEETITVTRGAIVVVPQGLAHASFNPTAAPAMCLVVGAAGTLT